MEQETDQQAQPDVELEAGALGEDDLTQITPASFRQLIVVPTDFTLSVLVDLLSRGKIDLFPNYQRRVAWTEAKMSRFIESLFLRLPVPQIVLAETTPGRFAVVDGKQRISSMAEFCVDRNLRLQNCEYRKELNGKTYEDLLNDERFEEDLDAFHSHTVRTTVVKHTPTEDLIYLLFLRLNQVSVPLSPQELRRALHPGPFLDWLEDVTTHSEGMRKIFKQVPDFRMRDMEVGTRHLAFKLRQSTYDGNMKTFLDSSTAAFNGEWGEIAPAIQAAWARYEDAIACSTDIFGDDAFKVYVNRTYQSARNRAVMDIMTHYFADEALAAAARNHSEQVRIAFEALCTGSADFVRSLQTTTKSLAATRLRFSMWHEKLVALGLEPAPLEFRQA